MTARAAPPAFSGLALDTLAESLGGRTRALAARRWLFTCRPVPTVLPERIPSVAAVAWTRLRDAAPLPRWRLVERAASPDGTVKHVLDVDGAQVETVLIPTAARSTVCVSSQSGCSRSCAFCATATLGFRRQLTAAEIVLQYLVAQSEAPPTAPLRNVVFMGMGEPMDNLDEVMAAVDRLLEPPLPRLAAQHVTVSTSGVLPGMKRFLREGRGQLALSLNASTDSTREALMPHTRQWPIRDLLEALREDQARGSGRRYFIEYVLWEGVNDSDEDARRLVELLRGLQAHVNLIPHNAFATSPLRAPGRAAVERFQALLHGGGVRCLVRSPRGQEISAACGQLALVSGGSAAPAG
ncbi:MAG TPA: 23S rRNA (adenine(2503)-C(2))-methyltransferase RlmN [Vicinamibacteria bacterium]|nr:23S rRNA (adenine(2503)-C(2))-methyltransferase RlmN [Vicinamibacteria bacterium]